LDAGGNVHIWFWVVAVLLLTMALTGCANVNSVTGQNAFASAGSAAVAFESIEGPPAQVVGRLMNDLSEEAAARQILLVQREGTPLYRIRGYLAYSGEHSPSMIAWAWDVYDADQHRAFRLSGSEPAGSGRRTSSGGWAADDNALRNIARTSIEQLAGFLSAARVGGALAYSPTSD